MSDSIGRLQKEFERALEEYTNSLPKNNLHAPVNYFLSLGGKRIRPVLVMLAGKAFGTNAAMLLPAALAVELFHNFSLVHDDIMDKAPLRRGRRTVHTKWDSNAAILSGDAMLIEAYKQLTKAGSNHLEELIELFNTTAMEVCEGQQLDMDFENHKAVSVDGYIEMISLKTAVLLGCSLKMGAILGNASIADAEAIYNFGKLAGIGFQIQDDYLDAFGDPDHFGKQVGGDILSNKKTFLFVKAMEAGGEAMQRELERIYFSKVEIANHEKIALVRDIFQKSGADLLTLEASDCFFMQARQELDKISIAENAKEGFLTFLEMLEVREK